MIKMAGRQEMLVFSLLLLVRIGNSFSLRHVMDRLNALELKFEIENRLRRSETEECFRRISEMNTGRKGHTADELVPTDDMTHSQKVTAIMSSTDSKNTSKETIDHLSFKSYIIKGAEVEKRVNTQFRKELEYIVKKIKTDNAILESAFKEEMKNFTEKVTKNQNYLISVQQFNDFRMKHSDDKMNDVRKSLIALETDMEAFIQKINNELSTMNKSYIAMTHFIQSCRNLKKSSGVYYLHIINMATGFSVFCDQITDGGGWIVIQRRLDGFVDFERTWAEYKTGFGDLNGEFWLGNDNIHALTASGFNELRIDMEDFEGKRAYAKYSKFHIKPESENYALEISGYSGNAGDSLDYHYGRPFSTKDRDNDQSPGSCSQLSRGAWWYGPECLHSSLNGYYFRGAISPLGKGVIWYHLKYSFEYSLKFVEMKIR